MIELERQHLYLIALRNLVKKSRKWNSNLNVYGRWDHDRRERWMDYIECQAAQGLPMAQEIVAEVVRVRMTG